jgi:hypothetical protein
MAIGIGRADWVQSGVDSDWAHSIRECTVAVGIAGPQSDGTKLWGRGTGSVRHSVGDGRCGSGVALHRPGLNAPKTDFRRKSNPDRMGRVEKGTLGCWFVEMIRRSSTSNNSAGRLQSPDRIASFQSHLPGGVFRSAGANTIAAAEPDQVLALRFQIAGFQRGVIGILQVGLGDLRL